MLWTKSNDHKMSKEFTIPDTIIYKLRHPTRWLFSSVRTGLIINKTEVHIKKDNIIKAFLKKPKSKTRKLKRQSEIVAQWMYDREYKTGSGTIIYKK